LDKEEYLDGESERKEEWFCIVEQSKSQTESQTRPQSDVDNFPIQNNSVHTWLGGG